jgi:hypothetical protein
MRKPLGLREIMGHEQPFPRRKLSGCCRFRKRSVAAGVHRVASGGGSGCGVSRSSFARSPSAAPVSFPDAKRCSGGTVAPRCFVHWKRMSPTPPAAA